MDVELLRTRKAERLEAEAQRLAELEAEGKLCVRVTEQCNFADPASLTAAAFAETIYGELYFPALKLLTGDETNEKIKSFVGNLIDELYVPFV